jgi:hypothetical protein
MEALLPRILISTGAKMNTETLQNLIPQGPLEATKELNY